MPIYNKLPLVSVIVLGYQHYSYIEQTLRSIFSQDYQRMEIIVSDDGSDFFPIKKIKKFAEENNRKITFLCHQENRGLTVHSNIAAFSANGEFIKFLSPGDGFCSSQALSKLVSVAIETKKNIVLSPAKVYSGYFENVRYTFPSSRRVRLLQKKTAAQLFSIIAASNIISAVGAIYSRDFFSDGGFDEHYRNLDDWPTWLKKYRNGEKIPIINEPLVYYRIGDGLTSFYSTAFQSPALRDDLMLCIKREILPWKNRLSKMSCWIIDYHLKALESGKDDADGLIYLPLRLFFGTKKIIKKIIVNKKLR